MTAQVRERPSSLRIEGVATALTSISHGGDSVGTQQLFRRERVVQPDGTVADVPIVSGNAWRGILRDTSAWILWDQLGRPELPLPVFHLLWSGGSLGKSGASHVISSTDLQHIRDLVPHVSIWGAAGGGRIIEGKLSVGKLVPICAETAHILPADLAETANSSIWDVTQIEEYTRTDDARRASAAAALDPAARGELGDGTLLPDRQPAETAADGPAQQMRYGAETLAAGTRMHFWLGLRAVTDLEHAWFLAVLSEWSRTGHVGGRSGTGHGRIRLDTDRWEIAAPRITEAGLDVSVPDRLAAHTAEHRDAILAALDQLA